MQLHNREVLGIILFKKNLGFSNEILWFSSIPLGKQQNNNSNWNTTSSFHIISISLFANHLSSDTVQSTPLTVDIKYASTINEQINRVVFSEGLNYSPVCLLVLHVTNSYVFSCPNVGLSNLINVPVTVN
jgi:hypothetical protein